MATQCHSTAPSSEITAGSIALVGHPNVGKSVIFQRLTGQRVIVSNYPGTTVEVARGAVKLFPELTLVDTPGVITFPPNSEDEQVTARVLLDGALSGILQVGDAKNLRRTLGLTVQLAEMGRPLVVALNLMDEAETRGMVIDHQCLATELGSSVVPTTAVRGLGIDALMDAVRRARPSDYRLEYPAEIETALHAIVPCLEKGLADPAPVTARSLGLLWLSDDEVVSEWLGERMDPAYLSELGAIRRRAQMAASEALGVVIQRTRREAVDRLVPCVLLHSGSSYTGFSARLGQITTHPVWGLFFLAAVLYAMYWFVGVFGAGTLVGLLEENLLGGVVNPWVVGTVTRLVSIEWLADLLVGQYGLWTMGITYAVALILPIVTTFFLAFGVLEDSGYLPRLAALSNRAFKSLGLNGKAVLPMVLGLGCVTMATLTTRVLESKRERLLVTLLLALAVPCSAQLGVVMGMLASISLGAAMIWGGIVLLVLFMVGWLAARFVPGERSLLLVELPPLRLPIFSNVVLKTLARLEWYVKEVVPLFLAGAALMFVLDRVGILDGLSRLGEPLVQGWLGLPAETSSAFLMGFLRRDFGATGLFLMQSQGLLSDLQVLVAMVTVTLFIPCVASVMMIAKERGWRTAAGMTVLIFPVAFVVGGLVNRLLLAIGWGV